MKSFPSHMHCNSSPNGGGVPPSVVDFESLLDWLDSEVKARISIMDGKLDRLLAAQAMPDGFHKRSTIDCAPEQLYSPMNNWRREVAPGLLNDESPRKRSSRRTLTPIGSVCTLQSVLSITPQPVQEAGPRGSCDSTCLLLPEPRLPNGSSQARQSVGSVSGNFNADLQISAVRHSVHTPQEVPEVPEVPEMDESAGRNPRKHSAAKVAVQINDATASGGFSDFASIKSIKSLHHQPIVCERLRPRRIRDMIFAFLDDPESGPFANFYSAAMSTFTSFTVFITAMQTVEPPIIGGVIAAILETLFDTIFAVDLGLRFVCSPHPYLFVTNSFNILDAVVSSMLIIRAFAGFNLECAPDYIRVILLCFAPTLRFMKTLRRYQKLLLIFSAFKSAFEALPMLLWFLLVTVMVSSSAIYLAERPTNIDSVPRSMWFVIVTLSTVGYGDIYPTTAAGHVMTALLIIFSALYMAMPLGIMGSAFTEAWKDRDRLLLIDQTKKRLRTWGYTAQDIPEIFGMFDTDNSGVMELNEFLVMMHEMRIGLQESTAVALFHCIDIDSGGAIDDREFVRIIFPEEFSSIYEMVTQFESFEEFAPTKSIAPIPFTRSRTQAPASKNMAQRYKRKQTNIRLSGLVSDMQTRMVSQGSLVSLATTRTSFTGVATTRSAVSVSDTLQQKPGLQKVSEKFEPPKMLSADSSTEDPNDWGAAVTVPTADSTQSPAPRGGRSASRGNQLQSSVITDHLSDVYPAQDVPEDVS